MRDKILLLMILGICLVSLVSASVEYTAGSDTICNNGVCTKTLYSGVRNVYEDGEWKRYEEARSLKDKGFYVKYIENDKDYPLEVIDFNATSIEVDFKKFSILNKDIPIKIWRTNESSDINDFKNTYNKIKEENVQFNLFNGKEKKKYNNVKIGDLIEFGLNSTTIILQDADTENLEDTYIAKSSENDNSGAAYFDIQNDTGNTYVYYGFVKFNISNILLVDNVSNCDLNLYQEGEYLELNEEQNLTLHTFYNTTWKEDDLTWNTISFSQIDLSYDNYTHFADGSSNGWKVFNCNSSIQKAFHWENKSVSFAIIPYEAVGTTTPDYVRFTSKEGVSSANRPYLNITYINYDSPTHDILYPENKTYNFLPTTLNVTSVPDTVSLSVCWYSLDGGINNNTWDCSTGLNTTVTYSQGDNNLISWVNDTVNNINSSQVNFTLQWGGLTNGFFRINEGTGTVIYDHNQSNNGTRSGASWKDDSIDNSLTDGTEYTINGDKFQLLQVEDDKKLVSLNWDYYSYSFFGFHSGIVRVIILFITLIVLGVAAGIVIKYLLPKEPS